MAKIKKIYLSFSLKDESIIKNLKKEKFVTNVPYEFILTETYSKEDENLREKTRDKIKQADGVIVLLSQWTLNSDKQLDELGLAINENKEILQIRLFPNVRHRLGGWPVKSRSADNFVHFINSL